MISRNALKFIDCLTLSLSGTSGLLALLGAIYAVPWRRWTDENSASKEYNKLWIVRLCLQLTAAAWLFCPFLELYDKWSSSLGALDGEVNNQKRFCRSYVTIRVGLVEPFFLLLTLLTFSECLTPHEGYLIPIWWFKKRTQVGSEGGAIRQNTKRHFKNSRIISIAFFWSIVVLIFQSLVPILDAIGTLGDNQEDNHWNFRRLLLLTYFSSSPCWKSDEECEACVIPLLSTLISALVIARYLWHTWILTMKMCKMAINQSLEKRVRLFRSMVTVLLLSSLFFRGIGLAWRPAHVLHEFCRFADFLSVLIFVNALSLLLVIRPIREGRIADKTPNLVPHL